MDRWKIALVGNSSPDEPKWIAGKMQEKGIGFASLECLTADDLAKTAGDADIVWIFGGSTIVDEKNIHLLPRCKVVLRTGTGTDNVAVDEATKVGITVANTPVAAAPTVADHAAALLLSAVRKIPAQDQHMRRGFYDRYYAWADWHLTGSTLGLIGFGLIGQLMAKRMSGFDMKMIAHDPYPNREAAQRLGVQFVPLDDLVAQSDFISIHCPLTPGTKHLINEQRLRKMKPKALIVNTARGQIIDEAALIRALTEKRIAGAALDVHEVEPLPADSPLLKLENVVMTPHTAGHSDTLYDDFWQHSMDTLMEIVAGRKPKWIVNKPINPRLAAMRM